MKTLEIISARATQTKLAFLLAGGHAVVHLVQANRVDTAAPEILELFLRHARKSCMRKSSALAVRSDESPAATAEPGDVY